MHCKFRHSDPSILIILNCNSHYYLFTAISHSALLLYTLYIIYYHFINCVSERTGFAPVVFLYLYIMRINFHHIMTDPCIAASHSLKSFAELANTLNVLRSCLFISKICILKNLPEKPRKTRPKFAF